MKHISHIVLLTLLVAVPAFGQDASPQPEANREYGSVEERRLLSALQEERATLDKERQNLDERKKELKRLEEEVDKKLDQLNAMRVSIEGLLAEKDARELKRIQELSKMYEKMTADQAARVFATLDEELAIAILENMKTKSAARILNNLDKDKAASLTAAFSTLDKK